MILLAFTLPLAAENDYQALHQKGREFYQGNRDPEALDIYNKILEQYPGDTDALLFRGRLLARLSLFEEAEKDLKAVIRNAPDYNDAYYALVSVFYWQEKTDSARIYLERWKFRDAENPDLYILSARVALAERDPTSARKELENAAARGAESTELGPLLLQSNHFPGNFYHQAGMYYEYLLLDRGKSDWQHGQAYYQFNGEGVIIRGEVNVFRRNAQTDMAPLFDAYFTLSDKYYLNTRFQAGVNGVFLPRVDALAELFRTVGTRNEAAISYRLMHFDSLAVHIPSFAWAAYPGKWYLRDKLSMIINRGISWQNQLTLRYFLGDADNYLQLMHVLGTDFNVLNNEWLQSMSFALSYSRTLTEDIPLLAVLSWTRDEDGTNRIGGSLGLSYRW
ncbi:MAG: YaiO family outer membrane beta-barrel protein [Candidatus Marinimicrobia bacterium]|nr:YaiO family outer membrane beta-barrel protein [Candidatus Neomarinimicrobiota bacterium]MDD5708992.1 YaiO family outer membrane beta-barrel protein [Candidatus Neomarinimicrobiota bacterium]